MITIYCTKYANNLADCYCSSLDPGAAFVNLNLISLQVTFSWLKRLKVSSLAMTGSGQRLARRNDFINCF